MPTGIGTALAVGGGMAAAGTVAGAMSKKSKSSNVSGVNLNPMLQGGMEEYIYGGQTPTYSTQQKDLIAQYESQINEWKNNKSPYAPSKISDLQKKIEEIQQNPDSYSTDGGALGRQFSDLQSMLAQGPVASDYRDAVKSQQHLAGLFGEYAANGGLPSEIDVQQSNRVANNLYESRQTQLNQMFQDQNTEAERLAARLGRPVNDPILQAKLRTGFIRQQDLLNSEKTGTAQQLALQLPGQRLNLAGQQTNILSALANQALQNRQYLLGLGNSLAGQERGFRLQTSEQYSNATQSSGGGLGGALAGGLSGLGAGLSAISALNTPSISSMFAPSPVGTPVGAGQFNNFASGGGFQLGSNVGAPRTQFGFTYP